MEEVFTAKGAVVLMTVVGGPEAVCELVVVAAMCSAGQCWLCLPLFLGIYLIYVLHIPQGFRGFPNIYKKELGLVRGKESGDGYFKSVIIGSRYLQPGPCLLVK